MKKQVMNRYEVTLYCTNNQPTLQVCIIAINKEMAEIQACRALAMPRTYRIVTIQK